MLSRNLKPNYYQLSLSWTVAELWSFCEHPENHDVVTMNYTMAIRGWGTICNGKMPVLRNDELNTAIIENHNAREIMHELEEKKRYEHDVIGRARQLVYTYY